MIMQNDSNAEDVCDFLLVIKNSNLTAYNIWRYER